MWYSLEPHRRGDSNEYPQFMFWAEIWKISQFLSENFQFFGGENFNIFEKAGFRNDVCYVYSVELHHRGDSNYTQALYYFMKIEK